MGHFLSDLDRSQEAVDLVKEYYVQNGFSVRELERDEQHLGDLEIIDNSLGLNEHVCNVEVKYDIMAARTGNLCFEMSNGKRPTGIMETKADKVFYVVPNKKSKMVFVFNVDKLREFIQNPENVTIKNGGDRRRFTLALAKTFVVMGSDALDEYFVVSDA